MKENTKPYLMIIDVQKGFLAPVWGRRNNPDMEKVIADLLEVWRCNHWPIVFVQHVSQYPDSPLRPGQEGVEFMDLVKPRTGERIIQKSVNSAFIGTDLTEVLKKEGARNLIFVGLVTDHCVSTSVRMAANLGFDATIVSDGCATFDRITKNGTRYDAQQVHEISLASLEEEFAKVCSAQSLLREIGVGVI